MSHNLLSSEAVGQILQEIIPEMPFLFSHILPESVSIRQQFSIVFTHDDQPLIVNLSVICSRKCHLPLKGEALKSLPF